MDPAIVIPEVLLIGLFYLVIPAALIGALAGGRRDVRCPVDATPAELRLDRGRTALRVFADAPHCATECSLWPERAGCDRACLAALG